MCAICAVHKVVDVVILSVLLCVHLWLQVLPRCQSSCVVNWFVYADTVIYFEAMHFMCVVSCVTVRRLVGSNCSAVDTPLCLVEKCLAE
jgi:hypothetical protein